MVLATVYHCNPGGCAHESIKYLIPLRLNTSAAKRLFNDGSNDSNRFSSTYQRIPELARMHLHGRHFTTGKSNALAENALSEGLELWP